MDIQGRWYKGTVIKVDESENKLLIHFQGWRELYDEWIYKYSGKITQHGQKVKIKGSDMSSLIVLSGQTADFTTLFVEGLSEKERSAAEAYEEEQRLHRVEIEKEAKRRKLENEKQKGQKQKGQKQKGQKQRVKESTEKKQRNIFEELVEKFNDIVQKGEIDEDDLSSIAEAIAGSDPETDNSPIRTPPARLENARRPKGYKPIKRWSQGEQQDSSKDALREAEELKEYEKFLDRI